MKPIYLDYNATTPIASEVVEAMQPYLDDHFGNPSSSHYYGKKAQKAVGNSRKQVADLIKAKPNEIVFTSGGTESNNYAILGTAYSHSQEKGHIITSQIEHPAVINVCKKLEKLGYEINYVPVDKFGKVKLGALRDSIRKDTILISIMYANNEIGTIQPVDSIAKIARENDIIFHTDAAQAVGKIPIDVRKSKIDLLSIAGHKFYAPKGVGALYVKNGIKLKNLMFGAGQEQGRRPGTQNVPEIVGLGQAAQLASDNMRSSSKHMAKMRDKLYELISESELEFIRNGDPKQCLPNTLSLSFADVNSIDVMRQCEKVAFSTGSACHSAKDKISGVLQSIGVPDRYAAGTVRLSTGKYTKTKDIKTAAQEIIEIIRQLKR